MGWRPAGRAEICVLFSVMTKGRDLPADFATSDALLWKAHYGRLQGVGPIRVQRSGRIGPLVEMAMARRAAPQAYASVTIEPALAGMVDRALDVGEITGFRSKDVAGVFPLSRHDPEGGDQSLWNQWAKHAGNVAVKNGIRAGLADGLIGAIGELQQNVYTHSERHETGLVAYGASPGMLEFVIADAGIGVLASLRQNEEFAGLTDDGAALHAAASDGASRFGRSSARGYGISQVFRALARDNGELRFRSGDHTLSIWGDGPNLSGQSEIVQKSHLQGFYVTICVRATDGSNPRR